VYYCAWPVRHRAAVIREGIAYMEWPRARHLLPTQSRDAHYMMTSKQRISRESSTHSSRMHRSTQHDVRRGVDLYVTSKLKPHAVDVLPPNFCAPKIGRKKNNYIPSLGRPWSLSFKVWPFALFLIVESLVYIFAADTMGPSSFKFPSYSQWRNFVVGAPEAR